MAMTNEKSEKTNHWLLFLYVFSHLVMT